MDKLFTTLTTVLIITIIGTVILFFSDKADRDFVIIQNLQQKVYQQQVDNDNLQYQLNECRMLYRGM